MDEVVALRHELVSRVEGYERAEKALRAELAELRESAELMPTFRRRMWEAQDEADRLGAEVERLREAVAIQARDYEDARAELQAEVDRLRVELEAAHLRRIEAENPGIDMDEVKCHRAALARHDASKAEPTTVNIAEQVVAERADPEPQPADGERLRALLRWLLDEGHITPVGVRQFEAVLSANRSSER